MSTVRDRIMVSLDSTQAASLVVLFPGFQGLHQEKQKSLHAFPTQGGCSDPLIVTSKDVFTALWECCWDFYSFLRSGFSAFAITEPGQGVCCGPADWLWKPLGICSIFTLDFWLNVLQPGCHTDLDQLVNSLWQMFAVIKTQKNCRKLMSLAKSRFSSLWARSFVFE